MRLYLASTSPARLATLRAAGIEPVLLIARRRRGRRRRRRGPAHARRLRAAARAREGRGGASAHRRRRPIDGFVLGGDSAFELDGDRLRQAAPAGGRPRALARAARPQRGAALRALAHRPPRRHRERRGRRGRIRGTVTLRRRRQRRRDRRLRRHRRAARGRRRVHDRQPRRGRSSTRVDGDPHAVVGLRSRRVRDLAAEFGVAWPRSGTAVLARHRHARRMRCFVELRPKAPATTGQ